MDVKIFVFALVTLLVKDAVSYEEEDYLRKTGIIGGKNVTIDQVKYIGVVHHVLYKTLGSAVIINKKWVLTSGAIVYDHPVDELRVRVGSTFADRDGDLLSVSGVYVHPYFNISTDFQNNIALLKLGSELKYSKKIQPISFSSVLPKDGEKTYVSGYGVGSDRQKGFLVAATVPFLGHKKCATHYKSEAITEYDICTLKEEVGPCSYDYGSPLVYKKKLIGVFAGASACVSSKERPPVYMNVVKYKSWIKQTIIKHT